MRFSNFSKHAKSEKGFTVIEAVVSASVFAFIFSSVLGVYLLAIQLDAKTRSERAVQQNARFIMDFLGKEIRNGSINYGAVNDIDTLSIINQTDEPEVINWDGASAITLSKPQGSTNLNSNGVKVTRLNFYLEPLVDPFDLANDVHIQPHVTIVLTLESNYGDREGQISTLNVQTTYTVREYPSRL